MTTRLGVIAFAFTLSMTNIASAEEVELQVVNLSNARLSLGLELSTRARMMVGVYGAVSHTSDRFAGESLDRTSYQIGVPLSLKLYLRDPVEGTVLPSLRVGATVGTQFDDVSSIYTRTLEVGAELLGGLWYLPVDRLAIGFEIGAGLVHRRSELRSGLGGLAGVSGVGASSVDSTEQIDTYLSVRSMLSVLLRL